MIRGAFAKMLGLAGRPDRSGAATIIIGLGNPGAEYQRTRHNVGFWCIDRIVDERPGPRLRSHRLLLETERVIEGHRVVLAKPRTYVNESGKAVTSLLTRHGATAERLIVLYDDMALPPGKVRLRARGGHGGHNGMRSIIEAVGSQEFPRVRIGIGRPSGQVSDVDHVLGRPGEDALAAIHEGVARAVEAIGVCLSHGVEQAMNEYN